MRIMRGGKNCESKKFAKINIMIALLKKSKNSRILNIVKKNKIRNSRKPKHAKITRSTVFRQTEITSLGLKDDYQQILA